MKYLINRLLIILLIFCSFNLYAQQAKIGNNIKNIRNGALLELEDNAKALVLPRIINPAIQIGTRAYRGMLVYDSTKNLLAIYNGTRWEYPFSDDSYSFNLYSTNGTLTANRQVNLGGFGLSFKEGIDSLYLKNGKVGLSVGNPISALHLKGAVRTDSMLVVSKKLYKEFNKSKDSIVIIDSIGRVRKTGNTELGSFLPTNVLNWASSGNNPQNIIIGGDLATNGIIALYSTLSTSFISNPIFAKDSIVLTFDLYVTPLKSSNDSIALYIHEYSSDSIDKAFASQSKTLVKGGTLASGLVAGQWNNRISYGLKLNSNTRFIRINYQGNGNNVPRGNGFKNMRMVSYGNSYNQAFVNGGNIFGTTAILGHRLAFEMSTIGIMTNGTNRIFIDTTGLIGMGTTTPSHTLDVMGAVNVSSNLFTPVVQGTSDVRLKKDISPIKGSLSKVIQMQGVTYSWRKEMEKQSGYTFTEGKDYGLIAQEIQEVLPELVEKDKRGFFTVDYPHIVAILVEAIREENQKINKLTTKLQTIEELTAQVQEIEMLNAKAQEVEQLKKDIAQLKAILQKKK